MEGLLVNQPLSLAKLSSVVTGIFSNNSGSIIFFFAVASLFLVAVINFALAAVILFIASRMNAEHGLEGVTELRDMAISDIEADIEAAAEEARDVAENVRQIARDPVGSILPTLIGPLISALLEGRARRKGK